MLHDRWHAEPVQRHAHRAVLVKGHRVRGALDPDDHVHLVRDPFGVVDLHIDGTATCSGIGRVRLQEQLLRTVRAPHRVHRLVVLGGEQLAFQCGVFCPQRHDGHIGALHELLVQLVQQQRVPRHVQPAHQLVAVNRGQRVHVGGLAFGRLGRTQQRHHELVVVRVHGAVLRLRVAQDRHERVRGGQVRQQQVAGAPVGRVVDYKAVRVVWHRREAVRGRLRGFVADARCAVRVTEHDPLRQPATDTQQRLLQPCVEQLLHVSVVLVVGRHAQVVVERVAVSQRQRARQVRQIGVQRVAPSQLQRARCAADVVKQHVRQQLRVQHHVRLAGQRHKRTRIGVGLLREHGHARRKHAHGVELQHRLVHDGVRRVREQVGQRAAPHRVAPPEHPPQVVGRVAEHVQPRHRRTIVPCIRRIRRRLGHTRAAALHFRIVQHVSPSVTHDRARLRPRRTPCGLGRARSTCVERSPDVHR